MDIRRMFTYDHNNSSSDGGGAINTSNYMTILALENGLTASLSDNACQYCIDGDGNWVDLPAGTTTQTINSGQTLSFRGNLTPVSGDGIGTFTISKKCNLEGNCMSLLFGDDAVNNNSLSGKNYAFYMLFYNCTKIIQVSETFLPATTLANYCYYKMFQGCTSLTTTPNKLPATTLANYCYSWMFCGCTSLTVAPELPATTLASICYRNMFQGCSSLTQAPELPATTLASYCYSDMFSGCTKLNYIKMLATNISASGCLSRWIKNVSSTGIFVKNANMTSLPTAASSNNYTGIPSGWIIVDDTVSLITFTVNGDKYYAEEGMTWKEFINSEYNDGNFTYNGTGIIVLYLQDRVLMKGTSSVYVTDLIVENDVYSAEQPGWGGGAGN